MSEFRRIHGPHPVDEVTLNAGERVWLCRCFRSKDLPYCDSSHKACPGQGPLLVRVKSADKPAQEES